MVSPSKMRAAMGWFVINHDKAGHRDGDRSLEQQMRGLEKLVREVHGKTVLDIGCAEGLISMALVRAGDAKAAAPLAEKLAEQHPDHLVLQIAAGHAEVMSGARDAALKLPNAALRVRIAGLVRMRQRPQTASGVTFLTLEDETGMVNAVLDQIARQFRGDEFVRG